jgi:hypothetical protein
MAQGRVYEVSMPDDVAAEDALARIRTRARGAGIEITGDAAGGTFGGAAEGRYALDAGRLRLEVEKKPSFVPWSLVEAGLRQVFGDVESVP